MKARDRQASDAGKAAPPAEEYFDQTLRLRFPERSPRVKAPTVEEHWMMAAAIFFRAGTTTRQRIDYSRRSAGMSVADLSHKANREQRELKRILSGKYRPGVGAHFWRDCASALKVPAEWLEHGIAHCIDGNWSGPVGLSRAVHAIGVLSRGTVGLPPTHLHYRDQSVARAAMEKIMDTPVLVPVLLRDLQAVRSAMTPRGREALYAAQSSGWLLRPDELGQYAIRKGR